MSHRSRSSSRIYASSSHAITAYGSNGAEVRKRVWLGGVDVDRQLHNQATPQSVSASS